MRNLKATFQVGSHLPTLPVLFGELFLHSDDLGVKLITDIDKKGVPIDVTC